MSTEKCLVGFSDILDWRPMQFLDLPPGRSCSFCNVIPTLTFVLKCSHVVCKPCYGAVIDSIGLCPFDGHPAHESDILRLSRDEVDNFTVRCCNSSQDCDFVGTVAQAKHHLFSECYFHPVTCNGCNTKVIRNDIVMHIVDKECQGESSVSETPQDSGDVCDIRQTITSCLESLSEKVSAVEEQLNTHTVSIDEAKASIGRIGELMSMLRLDERDRVIPQMVDHTVSVQLLTADRDAVAKLIDEVDVLQRCSEEVTTFTKAEKEGSETKPITRASCGIPREQGTLEKCLVDTSLVTEEKCKGLLEVQGFVGLLRKTSSSEPLAITPNILLCGYSLHI
ncbi:uncharacterized protein LOC135376188 [Ornithodoros turicata]|uniref:uncharacterized protein LOC135376188 n=1 Tax=Ornithodoros turicata TaxID=34597 RepID=UPI003138A65D